MSSARAWLEPRLASAPEELAAAIRSCLERVERAPPPAEAPFPDDTPASEALALAALLELDRVVEGAQDRAAALGLLAADALLTYAFEAAADLGHDLQALADRLGPAGALGARLAEALAASAPPASEDRGG